MNQEQLEALIAQVAPNNDPRRLEFNESTEEVEVTEQASAYAPPTKVKRPVRVLTWIDRGTGQVLRVQVNADGTYTKTFQGVDPKMQGEPATTPAQTAKDEQGTETGSRQETDAQGRTTKVTTYRRPDGTTYERTDVVQAAPEKPGALQVLPDGKGGRVAVQTMPDGTPRVTPLPGLSSDVPAPPRVEVGGQVYERDPATGTYSPAVGLPTEGQATAGGPKMPAIVVGAAAESLRQYHAALAADPTLTPAQREKYFQQAVQTANVAAADATAQANERESLRNLGYNTAKTTLDAMNTGLTDALTFASKLTLPAGSEMGGKAFEALLGLQMINLARSGIQQYAPGGAYGAQPAPPVPTLSPADLTNAAALEAKRQQIKANPVFRPQPEAAFPGAPPAPPARDDWSVRPGAAPAPPAAVPPPLPLPSPVAMPEPQPTPGAAPPDVVPAGAMFAPRQGPLPSIAPDEYGPGQFPGGAVLPQPTAPGPLPPNEVTQMPRTDDFAALAAYGPPPAPALGVPSAYGAPVSAGSTAGASLDPAARRAQIAATPPWRLSEDDYRWAVENGVEDAVWQIPGRAYG